MFLEEGRETGIKMRDDATEETGENCETTDGRNTPMGRE